MSEVVADSQGTEIEHHHLIVLDDYAQVSRMAADIVAETIRNQPGTAITLPTGGTPRGMYEELIARIRGGSLDFTRVQFFCLDDYLGKGMEDEASLTRWLRDVFLDPAGLTGDSIHFIPSKVEDPESAATRYEQEILDLGGLSLAVVGLGPNGHIGFNEPGSPVDSRARVVDLTQESRDQNAAYYDSAEEIPSQAMTLGLGTILDADRIVMIVTGAAKADILAATLNGPQTEAVPGSLMRRAGSRLTVIADRAAAAKL